MGMLFIFGIIFATVTIILPTVLIDSTPGTIEEPPSGNEFVEPLSASSLGDDDDFTERVCGLGINHEVLKQPGTDERIVSNAVFNQTESVPDERRLNAFVWAFGQFIDHDIVLSTTDPASLTFEIPMTPHDEVILNMKRVQSRVTGKGLESRNLISSVIDAGTVYGDYKDPTRALLLRENNGTACKLITGPGGTPKYDAEAFDFVCGDVRCSENGVLVMMHSLFLREHNRWCDELNQDWTEEQRFWKARSLVVAIIQKITYEEWLPTLFGNQRHLLYGSQLELGTGTRISTEFSTAAYRFGHSQIADKVGRFFLADMFHRPEFVFYVGIDELTRLVLRQHAEKVDDKAVDGLRNFLFSGRNLLIGEDLFARNIFRGRELGLPTYSQICACYGTVPYMAQMNEDPYVGLLMEPVPQGSSLPPTIAVVLAEQFNRLRKYDENFYTRPGLFNAHERYLIRQSTFKAVIVRNTNLADHEVQQNVFVL